ncbi:putative protein [alpha proteobacterium Q-1]|nr:putative protein [alpha proteobacterium Q-1]
MGINPAPLTRRKRFMLAKDIITAILSLLFVIGLIGGLAFILRRWSGMGGQPLIRTGRTDRRLVVLETRQIDARNKLVLIQCDGDEHLVLIGPSTCLQITSDRQTQPTPQSITQEPQS